MHHTPHIRDQEFTYSLRSIPIESCALYQRFINKHDQSITAFEESAKLSNYYYKSTSEIIIGKFGFEYQTQGPK